MLPFLGMINPTQDAFLRMPDIHGDRAVFTCEGDLWIGSLKGGTAIRLTRDAGVEQYAKFSPDGTQIAFSAQYDGIEEVYVISAEGGVPKRLTYRNDYAQPLGWTPDGKKVLFRTRNIPRSYGLYAASLEGGPETKLPVEFASHADMSADGDTFAWTRFNRFGDAWFHYKGGMQNHIWLGNAKTKAFKQITFNAGTNEFPAYEGDSIYFANENHAKFQLMRVNAKTGKTQALGDVSNWEIREINSGPGAVIYEKGMGLEMLDTATNKVTPVKFQLTSDLLHTKPFTVPAEAFVTNLSLSPNGKRVLAETRGQIISVPAGPGEARLWKAVAGARLRAAAMSPDAKKVAYFSDESGEEQLIISNLDGTGAKAITKDKKRRLVNFSWGPDGKWIALNDSEMRFRLINVDTGEDRLVNTTVNSWNGTNYDFSPDGKWIAYAELDSITALPKIAIYNIEKKEKTVVGGSLSNDFAPSFSKDGKYLAFLSQRSLGVSGDAMMNQLNLGPTVVPCLLTLRKEDRSPLALKDTDENEPKVEPAKPEPFRIDFDGLYQRTIILPMSAGTYAVTGFTPTRLLLGDGANVAYFDIAAKKAGILTSGGFFLLSQDGSKMLVGDRVIDTAGDGVPSATGKLNMGALRLVIDPIKEWRQMYWDAWRLLRDYFYVANMNGNDWEAIGKKYEPLLAAVRSRDELDNLIRWMQSELGSSHQYLTPGDEQNLSPKIAGGFLGIEVSADQGRLKIAKIYRGDNFLDSERSPLLEPGMNVKEGDYLLAIGGQELTDKSNYLAALAGRAGQTLSITVGSTPTMTGSRNILVKPIGNELRMKRLDWVEANRAAVSKASGGKIGYLYLGAMSQGDMSDFIRQYFPQRNKDAIIVDARFNNGGFVQTMINKILTEKLTGYFNQRASALSWSRQSESFPGPIVVLQNEFNVSCGEEFTHRFRDLKRGVIIGRRTYGGEVGSSPGWPLVDGGIVSVPNYGMWTPKDGWVIEGPGVEPDIDVMSDPNLYAKGRDAQIEKALEWIAAELKKNPVKRPTQPADPIRTKG
ncbi:MAG: PDZ domain-containing protein [Armatimonadetes bacterium]|nr:PDZ domain-containing protein [Armatimonadota bacterium]